MIDLNPNQNYIVRYLNDLNQEETISFKIRDKYLQCHYYDVEAATYYIRPAPRKKKYIVSSLNGPALIEPGMGTDVRKSWMYMGLLHRVEGPAFTCGENKEYWFHGHQIDPELLMNNQEYFKKLDEEIKKEQSRTNGTKNLFDIGYLLGLPYTEQIRYIRAFRVPFADNFSAEGRFNWSCYLTIQPEVEAHLSNQQVKQPAEQSWALPAIAILAAGLLGISANKKQIRPKQQIVEQNQILIVK